MSQKQSFIQTWERENRLTLKILRSYPPTALDLKPHAKLRTARDLMWVFVAEGAWVAMAMQGEIDFSIHPPPPPATLDEICAAFEATIDANLKVLHAMSEDDFLQITHFATGPGTIGEFRRVELGWLLMHDMIHHRGQLSIYIRLADGIVPSIYGPTADEPWH